jgi:hypothetical protein
MEKDIEEKPPFDTKQIYKIIKCPLKSVIKDKKFNIIQPIIQKAVFDINELVILTYQFIRLYLLDKFNNNELLPLINKQFILDIMKTIGTTNTNRGKKIKEENIKNITNKIDIKLFYDNVFNKLLSNRPSYTNKTHILQQTANEIITCINTNISEHFIKHLFKYINCLFKEPQSLEIKKEKDKDKQKELYKKLNEEIRNLKNDIINNKIELSDNKYHNWIIENKQFLYPNKINKCIPYDVKINPNRYIYHSIYINQKIEEITKTIQKKNGETIIINKKPYQFIPQRNNIVPKHITINSNAIVDIIDDKKQKIFSYPKSKLVLHAKKYQRHIWSRILKLEKKNIFNHKDYIFYNQIITDGISCSLLFILKKYKNKVFGDKLPKCKEEFEFPKLENLTKEKCDEYLNTNKYKILSCDPGKRRPISLIDENDVFYKYSACRRRVETYTKRSNYIINQEKINNNIIQKETELSKYNSKTLKQENYKNFINNKNKFNDEVKEFYQRPLFRKLNLRRFIRTKQSEAKLLDEIENKYLSKEEIKNGKKIIIGFGDYSRSTQMKGTISTPNIGIKKLLLSKFEIIDVNEYNTSKLYNKTLKELENVKIRKNKHLKHLHEILTPKEKTEWCIYVNRDVNACKNILLLTKYYLKYQIRPKEFKREDKKNK